MRRTLIPFCLTWIACLALTPGLSAAPPGDALPEVKDEGLVIELVAQQPALVHPVGICFDRAGRLLVIESHTHFRPKGYKGPERDRVLAFRVGARGAAEGEPTVFFEGVTAAMDLATHPDGSIYLATRNEVLRLRDADGDGVIRGEAERARIVFCDSPGNYPHNGLSGLAFDARGDLYFGMGENLGEPYKLIGADGVELTGGGEGGNVFRCTADGGRLQRFATGFWNPFGSAFDEHGELFCVDNDPDATPYCRLLHVVRGGDYGYQFRYGRGGLHPFQSWQGGIEGTLPIVSPTSEAPCELIRYTWADAGGLPARWRGLWLTASWADHRIEAFELEARGASYAARRSTLVQGGEDFRPVGLAVGPDGSLYLSDWVKRDYNLHGYGRLWRVRSRQPESVAPAAPRPTPRAAEHERLRDMLNPAATAPAANWLDPLAHDDPFLRHAASLRLSESPGLFEIAPSALSPRQRSGLLLAQRRSPDRRRGEALNRWLEDPDAGVRFLALKWVADEALGEHRPTVIKLLSTPKQPAWFYAGAFAALARIEGTSTSDRDLPEMLRRAMLDKKSSGELRRVALRLLEDKPQRLLAKDVGELLKVDHEALRRDALVALSEVNDPGRFSLARGWALDAKRPAEERALAVLTLAMEPVAQAQSLASLVSDPERAVRDEALRAMTGGAMPAAARDAVTALARGGDEAVAQLARRALGEVFSGERPASQDLAAWRSRLAALPGPADPLAGRRVFFQPRLAGCFRCHRVEGSGRAVGPELSGKAGATDAGGAGGERESLLQAVLQPSAQVQPRHYAWELRTEDGEVRVGFLEWTLGGRSRYVDTAGQAFELRDEDVLERRPLAKSIMPDGLALTLTDRELRDLLAYLESVAVGVE